MKEKDNAKCKEWERRRRGKLNDAFKNLSQLLPNYDPAKNLPKIDILERSTEFVKELRLSNSRLLSQQAETDEKCKLIKGLQDEVNKLILRVKQLTSLLQQAKIAIPIGPSIKSLGKRKLKWSEKLKPENVENKSKSKELNGLHHVSKVNGNISANETNGNPTVPTAPLKETINTGTINDKLQIPPVTVTTATTVPITLSNTIPTPDPPKTATVQLPMQTIILTPVVNQSPQMITRIALGPTRILPRPVDGIPSLLQKIAILPIRKPLPPKEKKRRRRKKKILVVAVDALVQTSNASDDVALMKKDDLKDKSSTDENCIVVLPDGKNKSNTPEKESTKCTAEADKSLNSDDSAEGSKTANNEVPDDPDSNNKTKESSSSSIKNETCLNVINDTIQKSKPPDTVADDDKMLLNNVSDSLKSFQEPSEKMDDNQMEFEVAQEIEISTVPESKTNSNHVKDTVNSRENEEKTHEPQIVQTSQPEAMEVDSESIVKNNATNLTDNSSYQMESKIPEKDQNLKNISEKPTTEKCIPTEKAAATSTGKVITPSKSIEESSEQYLSNSSQVKAVKVASTSTGKSMETTTLDLEPISTPNPETNSSLNDSVTGEKISECIARSIDLIDGPDGELMELADNWGDNAHSPKSPISPTQMFLSMFPLLPKDSIVSVSEGSQQGHVPVSSIGKPAYQQYSSHRSSFFIDAMLPEDHGTTSTMVPNATHSSNQNVISNLPLLPIPEAKSSNQVASSSSQTTSSSVSRVLDLPVSTTVAATTASSCRTIPISSQNYQAHKSKHSEGSAGNKTASTSRKATESFSNQSTTSIRTHQPTKELAFTDPLDFGTFGHIPLGQIQIPHIEDVFTSKTRNVSECQLALNSVGQLGTINPTANVVSNSYSQIDFFGNQFPSQPPQLPQHGQVQFPRYGSGTSVPTTPQFPPPTSNTNVSLQPNSMVQPLTNIFNPSVPTSSESLPNLNNRNFLQQSHHQSQTSKSSRSNANANSTQQQVNQMSMSYNVDFDLRQQPFSEISSTNVQKQSSNVKQNQLFRPHLGDCRQAEYPPPQLNTSISKASSTKPNSVQSGNSNVTKCIESQKPTLPQQRQPNQVASQQTSSQPQHSREVYPNPTAPTMSQNQTQPQRPHVQNQYQRINTPVEKQPTRNFQQKSSTAKQPSSKISQKSQSKDVNPSNTSSKKASANAAYQNQSKRSQEPPPTSEFSNPQPQHQGQMVHQVRRSEQSITIPNQLTPQPMPSFPDFSLSMNFNQPYEPVTPHHYISHNYSTPTPTGNPYQPHQQQVVVPQQKKNSKPTPYYLQDVQTHCESFNFPPPAAAPQSMSQQHQQQHVSNTNLTSYGNSTSSNNNHKPHYTPTSNSNPTPNNNATVRSSLSSLNALNNTNTSNPIGSQPQAQSQPQYFANTSVQLKSTPTCHQHQGNYPHQSPSSSGTASSRSQQQQQQGHHNISQETTSVIYNSHNLIPNNPNQHQQQVISQVQAKSKPSTSIPQQHNQNQPNYSNQQVCLNRNQSSSIGANNNSNNSNSLSTSSSNPTSRPVNWMTDTPYRTSNKSNSTPSSNTSTTTAAATNPFSVSKLVGNTNTSSGNSGPSNNNNAININPINVNANAKTPSNTFNPNTSYCAESLIRKNPPNPNPTWNSFGPSTSVSSNQHPQHPQSQTQTQHPQPHQQSSSSGSSQAQCFPTYQTSQSQQDHFNFSGYATTNFSHYSNYQQNNNPSDHSNSTNNVFSHFDPNMNHQQQQQQQQHGHQQYHHHFPQSHNSGVGHNNSNHGHHNPNPVSHSHHHQQHHGTTSSVSNFNLSSIFPEINDKRSNTSNNNANNINVTNNPPSVSNNSSGNNANSGNCGYYPGHGNNVSK